MAAGKANDGSAFERRPKELEAIGPAETRGISLRDGERKRNI
jgi:hypothetical protein